VKAQNGWQKSWKHQLHTHQRLCYALPVTDILQRLYVKPSKPIYIRSSFSGYYQAAAWMISYSNDCNFHSVIAEKYRQGDGKGLLYQWAGIRAWFNNVFEKEELSIDYVFHKHACWILFKDIRLPINTEEDHRLWLLIVIRSSLDFDKIQTVTTTNENNRTVTEKSCPLNGNVWSWTISSFVHL